MNVLSVDFDIIMRPSIAIYNNFIEARNIVTIDDMMNSNTLLKGKEIDMDYAIYQKVVLSVLHAAKDMLRDHISIGLSHEKILDFLKDDKDIFLVNIDHHHDITYRKNDDWTEVNCGNWVGYLEKEQRLSSYVWLHNPNSTMPFNQHLSVKYRFYTYESIKSLQIFCNSFDKIFLCLSPEWIPKKFHPLFCLLLDLLSSQNGYQLDLIT